MRAYGKRIQLTRPTSSVHSQNASYEQCAVCVHSQTWTHTTVQLQAMNTILSSDNTHKSIPNVNHHLVDSSLKYFIQE